MREGWQAKSLGQVLLKTETFDPLRSPEAEFEYIDVSGVSNQTLTIGTTQRLKGRDAPSRARRLVRGGDVLFATIRPTLRRIAVVPDRLDGQVCSTGYFVLRPQPDVAPRFLFYLVQSDAFMSRMETLQKGASYPAVTDADVRSQSIHYPPLPEQQRIVGILDEVFAAIATARTNAERNLQNARDLFESHLNAVFAQRGDGWVERRLGECVDSISTGPFGSLLHKSDYEPGGIPLVNPVNIDGEKIVPDARKAVGKATARRLASYLLNAGDVAIARRGEIGRCAVVARNQAGWLCGTGCFAIRPSGSTDPHFLAHLLRSQPYRTRLEGVADRATMPSISNADLADLVIRLPPVAQQLSLLAKMDVMSAERRRLAALYERKLAALEELKQSLLHQAFAGEL